MASTQKREYEIGAARPSPPAASAAVHRGILTPADKVVAAYLTIIATLAVVSASRVAAWPLFVAGHTAVIAALIFIGKRFGEIGRDDIKPGGSGLGDQVVRYVRSWYPLVLVPLSFKELEYLVPRVHPRDLDWQLAAIDYRLFGVNPTVWLERVTSPVVTEVLQLAYISYYFLPLVLGIPLWIHEKMRQYHLLLFALVLCFFISYLGYLSVPAIGPRFILNDQQSFPLEGVFLYAPIRTTLDWAEGITRDCFPSGHTAVAALIMYYARHYRSKSFRFLLPVGTALIISTVYLRYHYVIDVIAGLALAAFVIVISKPLYRALGGIIDPPDTNGHK